MVARERGRRGEAVEHVGDVPLVPKLAEELERLLEQRRSPFVVAREEDRAARPHQTGGSHVRRRIDRRFEGFGQPGVPLLVGADDPSRPRALTRRSASTG